MKTQSFNNRILTAAPLTMVALMMAAAIAMTGALHPRSAHAASTPAAADAPEGFRAKMREHMQERAHERMKEDADKKLTPDQVSDIVAGHIAQSGNPNIKVGKVTAKEESVVAVDVVTKTGALVATREISTKTGHPVNIDERMGAMMDGPGGPHGQMMRRPMEGRMGGEKHEHRDLALTTDQAKKLAEARLIMMGNKNLKVGAVKEKDADTITVDIVAASDNSLVVQRLIDRHTGRPQRGQHQRLAGNLRRAVNGI